jgi:hypothetical protein
MGETRHLVFANCLTQRRLHPQSWPTLMAGFLALQVTDQRALAAPDGPLSNYAAARREADQIADPHEKAVLSTLLDALEDESHFASAPMARLWSAYGALLETRGEWALAVHIYETILEHVWKSTTPSDLGTVFLQLGLCYRALDRVASATNVATRRLAVRSVDPFETPPPHLTPHPLPPGHREFVAARHTFSQMAIAARKAGDRATLARALHYRAKVEMATQHWTRGACLCAESIRTDRRNGMVGQESAFIELGHALQQCHAREAAKDAYAVVVVIGITVEVRATAVIHLIRFAREDHDWKAFRRYAKRTTTLTPLARSTAIALYRELAAGRATFRQAMTDRDLYHLLYRLGASLNDRAPDPPAHLDSPRASSTAMRRRVAPCLQPIMDDLRVWRIAAEERHLPCAPTLRPHRGAHDQRDGTFICAAKAPPGDPAPHDAN